MQLNNLVQGIKSREEELLALKRKENDYIAMTSIYKQKLEMITQEAKVMERVWSAIRSHGEQEKDSLQNELNQMQKQNDMNMNLNYKNRLKDELKAKVWTVFHFRILRIND